MTQRQVAVMKYAPIRSTFARADAVLVSAVFLFLLSFLIALPASAYAPASTPWLGVSVDDLSFDELQQLNLDHGLKVTEVVQASPAAEAGLQVGDILLDLDGRPLYSVGRLQWLVHSYQPGETLPLRYWRDGAQQEASVVLGSWQARAGHHHGEAHGGSFLGVMLQPLSDGLRKYFGATGNVGMLISEVEEKSPAAVAGLKEGDVIVRMDRKRVRNMADVYKVLNYFDAGDEIEIELIRDRAPLLVKVKLGQSQCHSRCQNRGYPRVPGHHGYGPGAMPYGHGQPPVPFPHHPPLAPIPNRS